MGYVTTEDGVEIYYKDWGPKDAPVIFFHHGWPLSADDWDAQLMFFVGEGFRVIATDRRGHGRSAQVWDGHDMDITPMTLRRWSSIWACRGRRMSAIRPAAASWSAISPGTPRTRLRAVS